MSFFFKFLGYLIHKELTVHDDLILLLNLIVQLPIKLLAHVLDRTNPLLQLPKLAALLILPQLIR